jgi:hypothetical protein
MVGRTVLAILLVLVIIFVVPFVVYSVFALTAGLEPPAEGSPLRFLLGIFVSKMGTAIALVLILVLGRESIGSRWFLYGLAWLVMFAVGEIGQAIGPGYSWIEAVLGIVSEAVYCPLSAYVAWRLVGARPGAASG